MTILIALQFMNLGMLLGLLLTMVLDLRRDRKKAKVQHG